MENEIGFDEVNLTKNKETVWVFDDNQFRQNLPLKAIYKKTISNQKTTTGKEIPAHIFSNESGDVTYILSAWNKTIVFPLKLEKECVCQFYVNKENKFEILRLN